MAEEIEEVQEEIEEKNKPLPFWQKVHPVILVGGLVLVYLALTSMNFGEGEGTGYMFLIIVVGIVLFLMSKKEEPKESVLKPYQAEHLVIKDVERKQAWGQFDMMSTFKYSVVNNLMHKDGRGLFYNVGIEELNPYKKKEYYLAKVLADGIRKGFVTWTEGRTRFTGRKVQDEKDLVKVPEFLREAKEYPMLERLWLK